MTYAFDNPFRRVALVHDWLVAQRGGENVLLELVRLFPEAPIYTLVHAPGRVDPEIEERPICTSFIQSLPGAPRSFRRYLPLFPRAAEAWDLSAYDLIVSSSHCVAKGVRTHERQTHLSYVHTPMRYLWDQMPHYLPQGLAGRALQPLAQRASEPLRQWDIKSSQRPTQLLANSAYVASRIARVWGRGAKVVYPPVDVDFYAAALEPPERRGYVVVSALVPYKRVDLAIRLANARRLPLTIIGDGVARPALERLAGPTVTFRRGLTRHALRDAYAQSEGLLFCGSEDFGIVPVEAMAAGCPVLALDSGGLCETVVGSGPGATGMFFTEPELPSMLQTLQAFAAARSRGAFGRDILLKRARLFDRRTFVRSMQDIVQRAGAARARRAV